ncbi:MAG: pseudouridine synthase [Myxococcota bacterium]
MRPQPEPPLLVLAYHKPVGLVTTHSDELGRETVYDRLIPRLPEPMRVLRWHAVGRLDMDTSGLLLFTTSGRFIHHATQPATGLRKKYQVLAKGILTDEQLRGLREGVELTGGLGRSGGAGVEVTEHQKATTWLNLEISEGKNREVRRMLLAVGSQVIRLKRVAVGGLLLDVGEDQWRQLSHREIKEKLGFDPAPHVERAPPSRPPARRRRRG